jgi:hypothetical protein
MSSGNREEEGERGGYVDTDSLLMKLTRCKRSNRSLDEQKWRKWVCVYLYPNVYIIVKDWVCTGSEAEKKRLKKQHEEGQKALLGRCR